MCNILELNGRGVRQCAYSTPPYAYHVMLPVLTSISSSSIYFSLFIEKTIYFNNLLCNNVCFDVGSVHPNGETVIGNCGANNF